MTSTLLQYTQAKSNTHKQRYPHGSSLLSTAEGLCLALQVAGWHSMAPSFLTDWLAGLFKMKRANGNHLPCTPDSFCPSTSVHVTKHGFQSQPTEYQGNKDKTCIHLVISYQKVVGLCSVCTTCRYSPDTQCRIQRDCRLVSGKHLLCMSVGGVVDVDSWCFLPQPPQNPGECVYVCLLVCHSMCHVRTHYAVQQEYI